MDNHSPYNHSAYLLTIFGCYHKLTTRGIVFFCLQKVFYAKSCIQVTDALNKNLFERFFFTNCLKKARKLFKKEKSCMKSEKLLEGLKVAPNLKSCSKVAEQLMDSLRHCALCIGCNTPL